ncbi:hypothetical protein QQF64_003741 [Cirrhinus molitorella]|uniref:Uncharacterized protein n=1 Tax=Cirrhinus molitorella TaxID=172907 RepID=A0ABR3MM69_9TELE
MVFWEKGVSKRAFISAQTQINITLPHRTLKSSLDTGHKWGILPLSRLSSSSFLFTSPDPSTSAKSVHPDTEATIHPVEGRQPGPESGQSDDCHCQTNFCQLTSAIATMLKRSYINMQLQQGWIFEIHAVVDAKIRL